MEVEEHATSNEVEPDLATILHRTRSRPLQLTAREQEALTLWDEVEELRLERSLLEVQASAQPAGVSQLSGDNLQAQVTLAEQEMLEARAHYMVRQTIIRNVLLVDPVLKAVHGGEHAHALEERLLPYINERDVLAMLHSTVTNTLSSVQSDLSRLEQGNFDANQRNQVLAQRVMQLARQLKESAAGDIEDVALGAELEAAEQEVRVARRKWRVMKGIAAGVVVGSGIDWAGDGRLMELVMDDEDGLG